MSYDPRFDTNLPHYPEPRPAGNGGFFIGFLFGAGMLIAAGAYLFPVLHRQWNEADVAQKIKMREADAKAEAEVEFRKVEARMKAEGQAAGERLSKLEIAPTAFKAVAQKTGPAVVNIGSIMSMPNGMTKIGEGSGVLYRIDKDSDGLPVGYIVTNSHVIHKPGSQDPYAKTDRVSINFASGRTIYVDSDSIYHDPFFDLAVIRFDAADFENLVAAEWGDSDATSVGDWVVAIGSPFGLKQSVTSGIISGKGRSELRLQQLEVDVLQTDAAINQGNSGGPLLDIKGRVIGINTAIATQGGNSGSVGVGFAIPSNEAKRVVEELLKPPHIVIRGYLGVYSDNVDPRIVTKAGVDGGALIMRLSPGSPAEEAGLQVNDLIITIKTKDKEIPIRSSDALRQYIRGLKPNDSITLEVIRGLGNRGNLERLNKQVILKQLSKVDLNQMPDQFVPRGPQRRR
jgi:S1-C subfamily serine protease